MNNSTAHKTLFIIGNGFDLDLNLKTSYHDFLDSSYFKSHVTIDFTKYDLERFNSDINIFNYLTIVSYKIIICKYFYASL